MNARIPLHVYATADPAADAAHFHDDRQAEQDAHEAMLAEAEQQAPMIVLARLMAVKKPGDWFRAHISAGGLYSPDELLCEAVNEDDATKDRIAELMTSPAALDALKSVAEFIGRKRALAIFQESAEERH